MEQSCLGKQIEQITDLHNKNLNFIDSIEDPKERAVLSTLYIWVQLMTKRGIVLSLEQIDQKYKEISEGKVN